MRAQAYFKTFAHSLGQGYLTLAYHATTLGIQTMCRYEIWDNKTCMEECRVYFSVSYMYVISPVRYIITSSRIVSWDKIYPMRSWG